MKKLLLTVLATIFLTSSAYALEWDLAETEDKGNQSVVEMIAPSQFIIKPLEDFAMVRMQSILIVNGVTVSSKNVGSRKLDGQLYDDVMNVIFNQEKLEEVTKILDDDAALEVWIAKNGGTWTAPDEQVEEII